MRGKLLALGGLLASTMVVGCTTFYGSATVNNGVAGCRAKCQAWDMELAGMLAMGEYSDGCICQVKGSAMSEQTVNAVTGGVEGVATQMRRNRRGFVASAR